MDLTTHYPRSVRETLGGYVHLARMIDKCRAKHEGTLGEYLYPCPMDQRLLEFLGISPEAFFDAVSTRSDEDMVDWIQTHGIAHTAKEIEEWNGAFLQRGPDTDEKRAYFQEILQKLDPTRSDITTWADLLDLEEERPVPRRS